MARYEGPQEIPSELWQAWVNAMGWAGDLPIAKKRQPFKNPPMQSDGGRVRQKQLAQRARFITAKEKFNQTSSEDRQRWFENRPPWNSFLWYYNYFIMSALVGNANIDAGGCGVIKSIQTVQISMPEGTGEGSETITEIDSDKAVVMIQGNSFMTAEAENWAVAAAIYPYISGLTNTQIKLKWGIGELTGWSDTEAATVSATIIEYI